MFYIYIFQNKINHKIYVGKTNNLDKRLLQHLDIVKNGKTIGGRTFNLIHKAISKYGIENFSFLSLDEFEDEKECLETEKFWIEFFRSDVNRFGNECGYNLTAGGDGITGKRHSIESRNKISKGLTGRKVSISTCNKQSKVHKEISSSGRSDHLKSFRFQENIIWPSDEELVKMINETNCAQVARQLHVHRTTVVKRINNKNLRHLVGLK